jgi:mRNA interferase RelE/StbE
MKVDYNNLRVVGQLRDAPPNVRKAFFKQIKFLAADLHHPSLHAKKYDERRDLWQARVTKDWRFYFLIHDDTYLVLDVIPHPK